MTRPTEAARKEAERVADRLENTAKALCLVSSVTYSNASLDDLRHLLANAAALLRPSPSEAGGVDAVARLCELIKLRIIALETAPRSARKDFAIEELKFVLQRAARINPPAPAGTPSGASLEAVKAQGFVDGYEAALRDVQVFRIKIAEPFDSAFATHKGFVTDMLKDNAGRLRASLSPAATQGDEAGGEPIKIVPRNPTDQQVADIVWNINRKRRGPHDLTPGDVREVVDNLFYVCAEALASPSPAGGAARESDFLHQRRGELVIERDAARDAVLDLIAAIGNDGKVTSLHDWNERMQRAAADAKTAIGRNARTERLAALFSPATPEPALAGETALYEVGNCLRGYFRGDFTDDDEAWQVLSERFNRAFPSREGRGVEMRKTIRHGTTAGGNETEGDRKIRESVEAAIERERAALTPAPAPDQKE